MGNCCRFKVKFYTNSIQFTKSSFWRIETNSRMSANTLQSWRKAFTSFSSGYKNLKCTGKFPSGRSIVRTLDVSDVVHSQSNTAPRLQSDWLSRPCSTDVWSDCIAFMMVGLAVCMHITSKISGSNKLFTCKACTLR